MTATHLVEQLLDPRDYAVQVVQIAFEIDGVGQRRDPDYLRRWLQNPLAVKSDARMPNLGLAAPQIDDLVAFLGTRK